MTGWQFNLSTDSMLIQCLYKAELYSWNKQNQKTTCYSHTSVKLAFKLWQHQAFRAISGTHCLIRVIASAFLCPHSPGQKSNIPKQETPLWSHSQFLERVQKAWHANMGWNARATSKQRLTNEIWMMCLCSILGLQHKNNHKGDLIFDSQVFHSDPLPV